MEQRPGLGTSATQTLRVDVSISPSYACYGPTWNSAACTPHISADTASVSRDIGRKGSLAWPVQAASELIRVEAICTARRLGGQDVLQRASDVLERINLIPISPEIIELATAAHTPPLRAMGAIHLATALTMREDLGAIFVYDNDLHPAAQAHDLNPLAPRRAPPRQHPDPSQKQDDAGR